MSQNNSFLYLSSKIGVQVRSGSHIRPRALQPFLWTRLTGKNSFVPSITVDAPPSKTSTWVDALCCGWIQKGFLHTKRCLPGRWERFGSWATGQKANTELTLDTLPDPVQFRSGVLVWRRVSYWIRLPVWNVFGNERGGQRLVGTRIERGIGPRVGYFSPSIESLN